jgi:tripartite-type tricarboxylate transporter receptor subunit TctC
MRSRTAPAWKPFWRPSRPVRLIAPFPPGGVVDLYARLIGQWLSERLGQPFVIENRVGAGGNVGTEAVVREPPDGYTLLQVSSANAWNATLYDKLSFNFIRDIAPIASIYLSPAILVVHPSFPAKSVPELAAYAKANPGKDQHGVGRCWERTTCLRGVVQGDGRRGHAPRALSRWGASTC